MRWTEVKAKSLQLGGSTPESIITSSSSGAILVGLRELPLGLTPSVPRGVGALEEEGRDLVVATMVAKAQRGESLTLLWVALHALAAVLFEQLEPVPLSRATTLGSSET